MRLCSTHIATAESLPSHMRRARGLSYSNSAVSSLHMCVWSVDLEPPAYSGQGPHTLPLTPDGFYGVAWPICQLIEHRVHNA